jgi:hypothetical protein
MLASENLARGAYARLGFRNTESQVTVPIDVVTCLDMDAHL